MCERRNTMVCTHERDSPRITKLDIHSWIYERMNLSDQEVPVIQIDGTKRQVFLRNK
jgi:hypothetical protein